MDISDRQTGFGKCTIFTALNRLGLLEQDSWCIVALEFTCAVCYVGYVSGI